MNNGVYLIEKKKFITSSKTLAIFKNKTKIKKAGIFGILDPLATGILPIVVGEATKFINFIPFFAFVRPKLANYLYSVLMGLEFYTENDEIVSKDQFGSHSWFS